MRIERQFFLIFLHKPEIIKLSFMFLLISLLERHSYSRLNQEIKGGLYTVINSHWQDNLSFLIPQIAVARHYLERESPV
jgi:hypothetical protein